MEHNEEFRLLITKLYEKISSLYKQGNSEWKK